MSRKIDFEITTYNYKDPDYSTWRFPYNYHYVYILENGKDIYIGETNDIIVRAKQHHAKDDYCYKYNFSRIHVITGEHMEETPAKHYERLLVKLMEIDGKFNVQNRRQGKKHSTDVKMNLN